MRAITFIRVSLLFAAGGCAAQRHTVATGTRDARGIYMAGMEGGLFRECNDSAGSGQTIAFEPGAERPTPLPNGGRSTWHGWTYHVYYVRWMVRDRGSAVQSDSMVRITSRPRLAVTNILEFRAPRPGECGWREGELRDPAP
jgi:hypothetical protein